MYCSASLKKRWAPVWKLSYLYWDISPSLSNLLSVAFGIPPKNVDFDSMNIESSVKSISGIELIPLSAVGLMILVAIFLCNVP